MNKTKIGNILLVIFTAFMAFGGVMMMTAKPDPMFAPLNLSLKMVAMLGCIKLLFSLLLWIPKFTRLSLLVLSAYLGGAIMACFTMQVPYFVPAITMLVLWCGMELKYGDIFKMN